MSHLICVNDGVVPALRQVKSKVAADV